jgi:hypothetical protein
MDSLALFASDTIWNEDIDIVSHYYPREEEMVRTSDALPVASREV